MITEYKNINLAQNLREIALKNPEKKAFYFPRIENKKIKYDFHTYLQLEQRSDCYARGFEKVGIKKGVKTILMVSGPDFFDIIFALFKVGAVIILVDPGMGLDRMLHCLRETEAEAFVGIPIAHILRSIKRKYFNSVKIWVTVGHKWFWGGYTLKNLNIPASEPYPIIESHADDLGGIFFTTGSTGPAKGVEYTKDVFFHQNRIFKSLYGIDSNKDNGIDMGFSLAFSIQHIASENTVIIPIVDFSKLAKSDPEKILNVINDHQVVSFFASPAILNLIGRYAKKKGIKIESVRRIDCGGAPATFDIMELISSIIDEDCEFHISYGATEVLSISSISVKDILSETLHLSKHGYGNCVGYPNHIKVKIIKITDDPIENWSDDYLLPEGEIGEIVVSNEIVSKKYYNRPKETLLSKININGVIWHRMGDLGWIDAKGRIWFCGRKKHRVITKKQILYTVTTS